MNYFTILMSFLVTFSAYAFEPVYKEAKSYSSKAYGHFKHRNNPRFCRFESSYNEEKEEIEIRVGVIGSPFAYFGWNAPIKKEDLPLKTGYRRVFDEPGPSKMVLEYNGVALKFKRLPKTKTWSREYPFTLFIDNKLMHPKRFKGRMEGFDRTIWGTLRKHVVQSCVF